MEVEIRATLLSVLLSVPLSAFASYLVSNHMYKKNITRENREKRYYNLYAPLMEIVNSHIRCRNDIYMNVEDIQMFLDIIKNYHGLLDKDLEEYRLRFISFLEDVREENFIQNLAYNTSNEIYIHREYDSDKFIKCIEENYYALRKQLDLDKL